MTGVESSNLVFLGVVSYDVSHLPFEEDEHSKNSNLNMTWWNHILATSSSTCLVMYKIRIPSTLSSGYSSAEDAYDSTTNQLLAAGEDGTWNSYKDEYSTTLNDETLDGVVTGPIFFGNYSATVIESSSSVSISTAGGISSGVVAGIVVALIAALIALCAVVYYYRRSSSDRSSFESSRSSDASATSTASKRSEATLSTKFENPLRKMDSNKQQGSGNNSKAVARRGSVQQQKDANEFKQYGSQRRNSMRSHDSVESPEPLSDLSQESISNISNIDISNADRDSVSNRTPIAPPNKNQSRFRFARSRLVGGRGNRTINRAQSHYSGNESEEDVYGGGEMMEMSEFRSVKISKSNSAQSSGDFSQEDEDDDSNNRSSFFGFLDTFAATTRESLGSFGMSGKTSNKPPQPPPPPPLSRSTSAPERQFDKNNVSRDESGEDVDEDDFSYGDLYPDDGTSSSKKSKKKRPGYDDSSSGFFGFGDFELDLDFRKVMRMWRSRTTENPDAVPKPVTTTNNTSFWSRSNSQKENKKKETKDLDMGDFGDIYGGGSDNGDGQQKSDRFTSSGDPTKGRRSAARGHVRKSVIDRIAANATEEEKSDIESPTPQKKSSTAESDTDESKPKKRGSILDFFMGGSASGTASNNNADNSGSDVEVASPKVSHDNSSPTKPRRASLFDFFTASKTDSSTTNSIANNRPDFYDFDAGNLSGKPKAVPIRQGRRSMIDFTASPTSATVSENNVTVTSNPANPDEKTLPKRRIQRRSMLDVPLSTSPVSSSSNVASDQVFPTSSDTFSFVNPSSSAANSTSPPPPPPPPPRRRNTNLRRLDNDSL
jgi:hypothetical protein